MHRCEKVSEPRFHVSTDRDFPRFLDLRWRHPLMAVGARVSRWTCGHLIIVWTERDEDVLRIINARWATRRERALYVSYLEPKP